MKLIIIMGDLAALSALAILAACVVSGDISREEEKRNDRH